MPNLHRDPFDPRRHDGQMTHKFGVAVARDHLGRHRLPLEAQLFADVGFDGRRQMGKGPHGARKFPDRDHVFGPPQPVFGASHFGVPPGGFYAKRNRFAVNAVRASHHERLGMAFGERRQRPAEHLDILLQEFAGFHELDRQSGVENVRRGQAHVQESRLGAHRFSHLGDKSDDVMLDLLLDGADSGDVHLGLAADGGVGFGRDVPFLDEGFGRQ